LGEAGHFFQSYNESDKVSGQRRFYSLKGFVTRSISLSMIFFQNLNVVFGFKIDECFLFKIHSSVFWQKNIQQNCKLFKTFSLRMIISLCGGPYYNLVIHRLKIFRRSLFPNRIFS
jgi:hypothetical protein